MTAPTVTGLLGVNAYDPALTFAADEAWIYTTLDDYWLQVEGTDLDTVTAVAFVKTGEDDRPADFHVLSSTLLEVKTPYTVLAHSNVRVTNPDGSATSTYRVTPLFAGEWLTHDPVIFDTDDISDWTDWLSVRGQMFASQGAKEYGSYGTPFARPALTDYADLIDTAPGGGVGISLTNTITNDLTADGFHPDPGAEQDDVTWDVAQLAVKVTLSLLFYTRLADLGVPGYNDPSLLPTGAVVAIPDGTDLETAFFDNRISSLGITIGAFSTLPSSYSTIATRSDGTSTRSYFDTSALKAESLDDTIEVRRHPTGSLSYQSTSALGSADLLATIDLPAIPPLRVPADDEEEPVEPYYLDPTPWQTADITDPAVLDSSRLYYTLVLTSYRTYDDPPDPGVPTLVTLPAYYGSSTDQAPARVRGASASITPDYLSPQRHLKRIALTWTPPRYRYFYTEPLPLATTVPLRQVGRVDRSRQYPRAHVDGSRQTGRIP